MITIPLTPDQFATRTAELQQKHGITLPGPKGQFSRMGVTANYLYDGAALNIEVTEKPFFVTTEYCEAEIKKFLGA